LTIRQSIVFGLCLALTRDTKKMLNKLITASRHSKRFAPQRAYFQMIFVERERRCTNVLQTNGRQKALKSRLCGK